MNLGHNIYKPISFWSWNGDMREDEIRWQIQEFQKQGFGGFFIHSRAGRLISYLSNDWFRACAIAVDEAKKTGLDVWLYDEDGWPSGFAGGLVNGCGEEYCAKRLRFCIGYPEEDARILSVYRQMAEDSYIRIDSKEATEQDLYCIYQIIPTYVDIMDRNVIAKFIEVTHEAYRKQLGDEFGKVIKGIFTDEPQLPDSPCWSYSIAERYSEKYGDDILDSLWLMYVNAEGSEAFRYRFWCCVNELVNQNFVCQINDWCKKNHLLFTGHFSREDGLCEQSMANGGVMPFYENMGMPGIDHLGNRLATAVLMKQVTSVAHRRNIPYVLSESFGCAGWDVSFKELLGIAGWQAVFGVNTLCTHLSAYTITGRRKRDYPTFFSYQVPWWEGTHLLFRAIQKLNCEIGASCRDTKVAVLHPIRSVWCTSTEKDPYHARFLTAQFRELVDNLLDIHVDFDLLDEAEMEQAELEKEMLRIGAIAYSYLIVPESITISEQTLSILSEFSASGGKVIFINGRPTAIDGDERHPMVKEINRLDAEELQNTRYILQKYFRANPIQDDVRLFDMRMENEISGIVSHYGKTEKGAILYLFNHQDGHDIQTIIRHKGICKIEMLSLTDDSTTDITCTANENYTYARLAVEAHTGVLLRVTYVEELQKKNNQILLRTKTLPISQVQPTEENILTLDVGRFQINGGAFSERKAIIHMLDEIYANIAGTHSDSEICVEYTFDANFVEIPSSLALAVEKVEQLRIELNGKAVDREIGWWIDKGIWKYDISGMVVNGTNTIRLIYIIPRTEETNHLKGKFESERNRFFYKIEPESIYICGQFDVQCTTEVEDCVAYYSVQANLRQQKVFTLVDATEKKYCDITSQGMWFYRGNCQYSGQYDYDGINDVLLQVESMSCVSAKVYVNKHYIGTIFSKSDEINLTPHLHTGKNEITLVAVGHNRNMMGPHHHIRGALHFVGQHTFMGVREFEDFVNPEVLSDCTWTDNYSFVPFGIYDVTIKTKKQE